VPDDPDPRFDVPVQDQGSPASAHE
jgi:GTP-binding protein